MFIQRTSTRSRSGGEHYCTLRLIRSGRDGDKVRQRTLLNLGQQFPVEQSDWPILSQCIDDILSVQFSLAPKCTGKLEWEAQSLAARLLAEQRVGTTVTQSQEKQGKKEPNIQSVDVDSLQWIRPRSVGVEQVG